MTTLFFLFWGSFVVGLSGAMMPGPMLTATISESMKRGFKAGPLVVLGHGLLEILLLTGLVFGLDHWLAREVVRGLLSSVGGVLLVAMGLHMVWTSRTAARQALETRVNEQQALHGPILAGVLTSLSNPYWTIWWATIGLGYAAVALERGLPGIASFYTGHISSDLAWFGLVAAAVASGRKVCSPGVYRTVLVLCGIALLGLGGWFLAGGVRALG